MKTAFARWQVFVPTREAVSSYRFHYKIENGTDCPSDLDRRSTSAGPSCYLRPRRRRRTLLDRGRRRDTRRYRSMTTSPLSLNTNDHLALPTELETDSLESFEMVAGCNSTADAAGRSDGPELV